MVIKNAVVLTEDFSFIKTNITIKDGKFASISYDSCSEGVDMFGKIIVPGLIDIHTHGACGCQAEDEDRRAISIFAEYMIKNGTTTFAPTFPSLSCAQMQVAIKNINAYIDEGEKHSKIGGIHLEGPYFSYVRKGGQDENVFRNPDIEEFKELNMLARGFIRLISLAPELDGAMEFIQEISKECTVSLGHSDCDYETAMEAIRQGVSNMTHTFNGMRPFSHREPNALGAAFDSDITCECISDGYHLHPATVRMLYKLVGEDRLVFISDSCVATGLEDGEYISANKPIYVKDGKTMLADGTISGGCTPLLGCVKKAIEFGIPAEKAFKCASLNPARLLKMDSQVGSIAVGKWADFLVLDEEYNLVAVYKNGELCHFVN